MALIARKGLCESLTPLIQIKRFRGKINIQKPRPPHFERAKFLAVAKPWFLPQNTEKKLCGRLQKPKVKVEEEVNPFQQILAEELRKWFHTSKLIAFCHYNPMTREEEYKAFVAFKKEQMHFKKFGKKTLEIAVKGTPYETVLEFYVSHNMIIFSPEPKVKELIKILKRYRQLVLLAGIYDNKLLSKDDLIYYSNIPNLQAAQASLVQTLNSAQIQFVSHLSNHQSTLVSHLEQRINQLKDN